MNRSRLAWLVALGLIAGQTAVAAEQPADGELLDEIVVTADFRGRSLRELPSSIALLDGKAIDESRAQHFEALIPRVANMNWSGDGHRPRYFQLRGVGELEQYQGAPNPSIGFVLDDIDLSGIGTVATLFDLGSIEVLRGPQGSRYGANALGGLIYLRSADPDEALNGRIRASVGDDAARGIGLALGGPLNDSATLTARGSAEFFSSDGFRRNAFLGRDDTNGRDESSLRLRMRYAPKADFSADVAVLLADIDNGYDAFALDNSLTVLSDNPGRDAQRTRGASLRLVWQDVLGGEVTALSSLAYSDIDFDFDADWGNSASWAPVTYDYVSRNARTRSTFSQEFRYQTSNWLAGVYWLRLSDDLRSLNTGDYYDPFYDFADSLFDEFDSGFDADSLALFAQYNFIPAEDWRLSAGLRLENRRTDYSDSNGLRLAPSDRMFGGEISLSRDLDDASLYVTLARGYKAGGFNLGAVPSDWRFFDKESLWTLETGIKADLFAGRAELQAAVFHNWRNDQQVRASFQLIPGDPASFSFATVNVDGARNYGAEVDLSGSIRDSLDAYLSVGLLFGGFGNSVEQFPWLEGRDLAHAPRYTWSAGLAWRRDNGFFLRLDASAKDAFFFDVSHNQYSQAYTLTNLQLGRTLGAWEFTAWVRNLADKDYAVRGFFFGNEPPDFPDTLYTRAGDPRQFGVTLDWRF